MNLHESLDAVHQKYKKNKLSAFNELLNVAALYPMQMKEIASFIVNNSYHKNSKKKAQKNAFSFWKSDFVSQHFVALIKTSSVCDLLDGYFNQLNYHRGYYLNPTIIETAFKENSSLLVQVILHTNTLFEVKHLKHILSIPSLSKMLYSEKEMLFVKTVKLSRLFLEEKHLNSLSQYIKSQLKLEFHYWYKQEKRFEAAAKEYYDK